MNNNIVVRGAREHNLKDLNVEIPRHKLVVITGLSGSGKSSLAFDTIYAEGQRRYVESLSAYARQFLELMQKPDVDSIEGLSPAISIEQKTTSKNPRSTVATVTEIYDYMRLLYARIGIPYSPATGKPIQSQTVSQIVDQILSLPEGTKLYLMAPIVRGRKGEYRREFQELLKKGYQRVKVDGEIYELDQVPDLDKQLKHEISVIVDRLVMKQGLEQRLAEGVEATLKLSDGLVQTEDATTGVQQIFSEKFACPVSGFTIEEIEPRLFSFNNPYGACPDCNGLGEKVIFNPDQIVPDPKLSILEGAVAPWHTSFAFYYNQILSAVIEHYGEDPSKPFKNLSKKIQEAVLYGTGATKIPMTLQDGTRSFKSNKPFEGVIPSLERRWKETEGKRQEDLSKYQISHTCQSCKGYRLKPEALAVKLAGYHISQVSAFSIEEAVEWFKNLDQTLSVKDKEIAHRILKEINERLRFLTIDFALS